jgi:hypothetical protein
MGREPRGDTGLRGHGGLDVGVGGDAREVGHEGAVGAAREAEVGVVVEAEVAHGLPRLAVGEVAQGAAKHRARALDVVGLEVRGGVAVGVALEGARALDGDDLGVGEEVAAGNLHERAVAEKTRGVAGREHDAPRRPRKLVPEGVVVGLRRRQAAAVRLELHQLAARGADAVDDLHRAHVVDARVEAELVEQDDAGRLGARVEGAHRGGDIRRGDQVLAVGEAALGDGDVVDVREHRHAHVALGHEAVEGVGVGDVKRHGLSAGVGPEERLGAVDAARGDGDGVRRAVEDVTHHGTRDESGAEDGDVSHRPAAVSQIASGRQSSGGLTAASRASRAISSTSRARRRARGPRASPAAPKA